MLGTGIRGVFSGLAVNVPTLPSGTSCSPDEGYDDFCPCDHSSSTGVANHLGEEIAQTSNAASFKESRFF